MSDTPTKDALERFMPIFSSLPIEERKQIVVVIDEQPISWNMAYNELRYRTKIGDRIAKKLIELDII